MGWFNHQLGNQWLVSPYGLISGGGYGRLTSHDADLKIEPGPHAHREAWSSVGEMRCSKYGAGFLHLGGEGWQVPFLRKVGVRCRYPYK